MKSITLQGREIMSYEYEKKRTLHNMLESGNYGEENWVEQKKGARAPGRVTGPQLNVQAGARRGGASTEA